MCSTNSHNARVECDKVFKYYCNHCLHWTIVHLLYIHVWKLLRQRVIVTGLWLELFTKMHLVNMPIKLVCLYIPKIMAECNICICPLLSISPSLLKQSQLTHPCCSWAAGKITSDLINLTIWSMTLYNYPHLVPHPPVFAFSLLSLSAAPSTQHSPLSVDDPLQTTVTNEWALVSQSVIKSTITP